MAKAKRRLRAIDLYSGVGGWSLGLQLSGVNTVASYEYWAPANETNFKNNHHQAQTVDIRRLSLDDLPENIDIVVGSPPCTQFSFSNRGGSGDIADGLEDIKRFLVVVDYLKPKVWAMENVPRVAKIVEAELQQGGALEAFAHLGCNVHVIDMSEYGLPQRRRRCIAGNFDIELLQSYRNSVASKSLGDVISALSTNPIIDPIFGVVLPKSAVSDHVEEHALTTEEARINRANKTTHPVYNAMPFPDPMDRAVRTITATCTRVSRESIVVPNGGKKSTVRRLTLRERACLQGFPLTFQFYGASYSQKIQMIGNAVPPAFSYFIGHAFQGHEAGMVAPLSKASLELSCTSPLPPETPPDRAGGKYQATRRFRFAIPDLRLKSGVRFELRNEHIGEATSWRVAFFFGNSKDIRTLVLDTRVREKLLGYMSPRVVTKTKPILEKLVNIVADTDIENMQRVWAHKGPGGTRAFTFLDKIGEIGASLARALKDHNEEAMKLVDLVLHDQFENRTDKLPGLAKLHRNAALILAGLLVGSVVNPILTGRTGISEQLETRSKQTD